MDTVLVANHDPFDLRLLQQLLETAGYRVLAANDGEDMMSILARELPDTILLGSGPNPAAALALLREVRGDDHFAVVPVVMAIPAGDEDLATAAIQAGALDLVERPFQPYIVKQRIRAALRVRRAEQIRASMASLAPRSGSQEAENLFHVTLEYEFNRAARYGQPLALVRIATGFGPEGIAPIEKVLQKSIRLVDHLFGLANGSFALILPHTDRAGVDVVLDRIQTDLVKLLGDRKAEEIGLGSSTYAEGSSENAAALWSQTAV
ncbi:MAG: response regulator [Myxococcales bacterium]|nr:response regulator [Myxococcales bacterium]